MLIEMLINHETAIALTGRRAPRFTRRLPPIVIKTIEHEAWQESSFPSSKGSPPVVLKSSGTSQTRVLEYCDGPYRNPWF